MRTGNMITKELHTYSLAVHPRAYGEHLESTPSNWDARINIVPELGRLTTEGMSIIIDTIEYRLDKGNLSIPCIKKLIDIHDNLQLARHTLGNHEETLGQMLASSTIPNLEIMQYLESITF